MPDIRQKIASPAAVAAAEKARPNWKAVPVTQVAEDAAQAEAATPELGTMLRKYFGGGAANAVVPAGVATSELVAMEPLNEATTRVGRKVVIVQNGQILGEQG